MCGKSSKMPRVLETSSSPSSEMEVDGEMNAKSWRICASAMGGTSGNRILRSRMREGGEVARWEPLAGCASAG